MSCVSIGDALSVIAVWRNQSNPSIWRLEVSGIVRLVIQVGAVGTVGTVGTDGTDSKDGTNGTVVTGGTG